MRIKSFGVLEGLKAFNLKLNIQKSKDKAAKQGKKPSERLLKAMKESKEILKNPHLYPSYTDAKSLLKGCLK